MEPLWSWGRRSATVERMTIRRMEHVGIVVDDLAAATAFFVELGLKLQGEGSVGAVGSTAWWGSRASAWSTR
jgi:bleomycin resistance family protein